MLHLTKDLILGQGTRRTCYAHPQDPTRCIKVTDGTPDGIRQQKRETRFYQKLKKRNASFAHIADYLGPIETDQGSGHIYERIINHDGSPSPELADELNQNKPIAESLVHQFNGLLDYLIQEKIIFYDLNGWNVLVQHTSPTTHRLVIIDGLGEVVAVPILNIFPAHLRRTIRRRWRRVHRRMTKRHPDLAHLFKKP